MRSPRNSSTFFVALHFAIPGGRTDFATAAIAAVLVVQEDPSSSSSEEESSSEDSAGSDSDSDGTWYFAKPGGQASSTSFAPAVAAALFVALALRAQPHQKTFQTRILSRRCTFLRAQGADFATAVVAALVVSFALGQEDPASPEDTADSTCETGMTTACSGILSEMRSW